MMRRQVRGGKNMEQVNREKAQVCSKGNGAQRRLLQVCPG